MQLLYYLIFILIKDHNQGLIFLQNNNKSEQKKGYRLLEEICSARSEAGLGFASEHLEELSDYLAKSFESSDVISKAVSRVPCRLFV